MVHNNFILLYFPITSHVYSVVSVLQNLLFNFKYRLNKLVDDSDCKTESSPESYFTRQLTSKMERERQNVLNERTFGQRRIKSHLKQDQHEHTE